MSAAGQAIAIADYRPRPELLRTRDYDPKRYSDFRVRTGRKPFAPDFNTRLIAVIVNQDTPDTERVDSWVRLMANGNFNDMATDDADNPLGQADCARALGLSRQRVSIACDRLETDGRLRRTGRELYPVHDPIAELESRKSGNSTEFVKDVFDKRRMKGEYWRRYQSERDQEHPEELELLRAADELKQRRWTDFQKKFKSKMYLTNDDPCQIQPGQEVQYPFDNLSNTPLTNDERILIEQGRKIHKGPSSSSSSALGLETTTNTPPPPAVSETPSAPPQPPPTAVKNLSVDEHAVSEALSQYTVPEPAKVKELLRACRAGTPDATGAEIAAAVHSKRDYILRAAAKLPYILVSIPPLFADGAYRRVMPPPSQAAGGRDYHVPTEIRRLQQQLRELRAYQQEHDEREVARDIAITRDLLADLGVAT